MKTNCSLSYCLKTLTPPEYVVYLACCELWLGAEMELYAQSITDLTHFQPKTVRAHLKYLQKKGFIVYDSTKQKGTVLFWVRMGEREKQPDAIAHHGTEIVLRSPEGKIHKVRYGKGKEFCEKHGLNSRSVYRMTVRKQVSHNGWTLVSAG